MQASTSIRFDPIPPHRAVLHPWEIILAALLFAGLIYLTIRRSRRRAKESASLNLRGR